jgi:hypothetical protein
MLKDPPKLDSGDPQLVIDKKHHDSDVILLPGDSLVWKCGNCPNGVDFMVKDIRHVANLTKVGSPDAQSAFLVTAEAAFESAAGSSEKAALNAMLAGLQNGATEDPGDPFEAVPSGFIPGDKPTPPSVYKWLEPSDGTCGDLDLWKFTWVVQTTLEDKTVLTDEWDPHFRGHRKK